MKIIVKTSIVLAVTALLGAAFTQSVFAADDAKKGKKDRFTMMDADKDGKVTLEEYSAVMAKSKKDPKPTAEVIGKNFKRLDKDKSSSLSKEELASAGKKKGATK